MDWRIAHQGLTLIEALFTIAVLSILLGIALPTFGEIIERQRSWTTLNELRTSLHQAREYAARHNTQVSVCRSANQAECMSGEHWSDGWIVFEDPVGNRDCEIDAAGACSHGGRVLSVSSGTANGIYITANHFVQDTVRFYPSGFAKASNGTFTACNSDGDILRGMVLAWSGRVRVAEAGDSTSC